MKLKKKNKTTDRQEELFGKLCRDKITGFEGVCTGRTTWLYGCDQYVLTPKVKKDGKLEDGKWFDDGRIEIIEKYIEPEDVQAEKNGGIFDESVYASNSKR